MGNDTGIPSYVDAMTALVKFVSKIARNEGITSHDAALAKEAQEILGDFIIAGLVKLAERKNPQTLEELEKENSDGFRNP